MGYEKILNGMELTTRYKVTTLLGETRIGIEMGDQEKVEYSLTLKGEGISIEKKIDGVTAASIIAAVMGGATGIHSVTPAPKASSSGESRPRMSMGEFLEASEASTNNERITTVALFLFRFGGKQTFTADDIKQAFKEAREPLPTNLSRDISRTVKARWIAPHDGGYQITTTGEKAVDSKFGRS